MAKGKTIRQVEAEVTQLRDLIRELMAKVDSCSCKDLRTPDMKTQETQTGVECEKTTSTPSVNHEENGRMVLRRVVNSNDKQNEWNIRTGRKQKCDPRSRSTQMNQRGSHPEINVSNRFSRLAELEESDREDSSVVILGDSNVSRLVIPLRNKINTKNQKKVRIIGVSGLRTSQAVERMATEVKKEKTDRVRCIVHVGTNDTNKIGSQELLLRLRQVVRVAKQAREGVHVTLCTLPSRVDKGGAVFSRSESVNAQLEELCREEGASLMDIRCETNRLRYPLARDGLHYSRTCATRVGAWLAAHANSFLG